MAKERLLVAGIEGAGVYDGNNADMAGNGDILCCYALGSDDFWLALPEKASPENQQVLWLSHQAFHEESGYLDVCTQVLR